MHRWLHFHPVAQEPGGFVAGRARHPRHGHGSGGHKGFLGGPPAAGGGGHPWGRGPSAGNPFWFFFHRGPRARRGDVRAGILALLTEQPRNGYQIMQELEQRSRGVWRPSPGSVYPALQQLEDEGLARAVESSGGRVFELTDRGRVYVKEHADELSAPWDALSTIAGDDLVGMLDLCRELGIAASQVVRAGNAAQVAKARKVITDARRALYRLLAEDVPEEGE